MRHPLSRAIALALIASATVPAFAQEAARAANEGDATALDKITVSSSLLSSQGLSLDLQREAVNVANVIASDAIGDFPDQTAAAALSRAPGVAVQRDQGQERYIQLRGAPEYWTAAAFDGVNVLGLDLESNSRAFRFDAVPSNVIDVVTINKNLTPAMPSEALAGRVNIETVSAFARKGFHGQVGYGTGPQSLGDGDQKQGDLRLSWSNDKFGILVGASTYERDQTTDNREADYDGDVPTKFDMRSYLLTRETNSRMAKLEFRPADGHQLGFTSLYTEFLDHEQRNQYVFNLAGAASGYDTATATAGSLTGVPLQATWEDGNYATKNRINTLSGSHVLDTWQFDWAVNNSKTEATTYLPLLMQTLPSVNLDYTRGNPNFPIVSLKDASGAALSALPQAGASTQDIFYPYDGRNEAKQTTFKFDAKRALDIADGATLGLGIQVDRREVEGYTMGSPGAVVMKLAAYGIGTDWNLAPYITDKSWDSGFARGFDVKYKDNAAARDYLFDTLAARGYSPTTPQDSAFSIDENVDAAYAQLEVRNGVHQFLAGARLERTEVESRGYSVAGGVSTPISVSHSESEIYPSVHWNVDINDTLKLRNALVTGSARPGFGSLRAGASINDVDEIIGGGNPELKPESAWGYDGSLEWYFAEASIASVGLFYRDVKDVLYSGVGIVDDDRYDSDGIDRTGYEYSSTYNGDSGKFTGLELNWQQALGYGFGSQLNLTFIDSELTTAEGRKEDFSGTSEKIVNASLFWENYGWSVRLAYQWREAWLSAIATGASSTGNEYRDDVTQVDLSVRYALNDHVGFFFDGNNLTNETFVTYQGVKSNPVEVESIGRRFMAGVRLKF